MMKKQNKVQDTKRKKMKDTRVVEGGNIPYAPHVDPDYPLTNKKSNKVMKDFSRNTK